MSTVALTYAEIANRLGIAIASAKMRARRSKWARVEGNDGRTRVMVPFELLNQERPAQAATPSPEASAEAALLSEVRMLHTAEIARLTEAHRDAIEVLRVAHLAEVERIEAAHQRERDAHQDDLERLRALHAAEIARLEAAFTSRMSLERIRVVVANMARWISKSASNRSVPAKEQRDGA